MKKDDKKEDKSKTIEEKAKEILKNNPIYWSLRNLNFYSCHRN